MIKFQKYICNNLLEIHFDEYYELLDAKKKMESKHPSDNLFLKTYNYYAWFENEKSANTTKLIYHQCYQ